MTLEIVIQWLGALLAFFTLGFLLYSIWRGTQRQVGRKTGKTEMLKSPFFYLIVSSLFLAAAWFGWIPLPLTVTPPLRTWILVAGALLYFPGLALVLWGRFILGKNYFVSTGLGAQLFSDHKLVTAGPYAFMRHPMYTGLILAAWGALFMYGTWTTVYFAIFAPFIAMRARREEQALAAEFGEQWMDYSQQVPAFIPRWRRR